jgi:Flp pilus assembly protein TadD
MDLFRTRGDDRAQHGDYNGAAMMYDEALRYAPTDTTILLSRSFAHMMSTPPRLDLALQDADAVIQHNPTNWQGWLQKGDTCLRAGEINGAEEALKNAVGFAQGVDKFTAQRLLADVQARRGRNSSAAKASGTSQSSAPSANSNAQTSGKLVSFSHSKPTRTNWN